MSTPPRPSLLPLDEAMQALLALALPCLESETVLLGITTNWQFLRDVLNHHDFVQGKAHTTWIDEEFTAWQAPLCELPAEVLAAAALTEAQTLQGAWPTLPSGLLPDTAGPASGDRYSPWRAGDHLRLGE